MLKLNGKYIIGVTGVLVVTNIALVLALIFFIVKPDWNLGDNVADSNTYQAIFLTNDQIYFGRLKNVSSDYLILSDVYYIKVNESGAGQIVKLGVSEPHAPKNEMIINQDQVLFWENLKVDSPVIKTIQSMQSQDK